jgi:hypothetical protein
MLSREAANTHFIVFGFTRSGLKSMIYRTRGEHTKTITPSMLTLINEALHSHIIFGNTISVYFLFSKNI